LPLQPDPRLFEAARQVGAVADFLVITANGPHILQEQIEQAAGCEVLSMIEVTLSEVRRLHWRRIGVLGLGEPLVYLQPLEKMGISYETLAAPLRSELDSAILALMAGQADEAAAQTAWEAISFLQAKGVDGTILGCTEVPLMLGERADESDLVNPAQLLAEAGVRYALT
jgi:aspartate racemase